jgi:hypothetical protein
MSVSVVNERDDNCRRDFPLMRQAHGEARDAGISSKVRGGARKSKLTRAVCASPNLDRSPIRTNTIGSENLDRRFLRREARGEAGCVVLAALPARREFVGCEHAVEVPIAKSIH